MNLDQIEIVPHILVTVTASPCQLGSALSYIEYVGKIERLINQQTENDLLVWNTEYSFLLPLMDNFAPRVIKFSARFKADSFVYNDGQNIIIGANKLLPCNDFKLPGTSNMKSYLAAIAAVCDLIPTEIIAQSISSYSGYLNHYQLLSEDGGITVFNNACSVYPSQMIGSFQPYEDKIILITGGRECGYEYKASGMEIVAFCKALVLIGDSAASIRAQVENTAHYSEEEIQICEAADLREALAFANNLAAEGDVILFSPASPVSDSDANNQLIGKGFTKLVQR